MDIEILIRAKFSGELSEASTYINLTLQAVAVMIGGILLWRLSNAYHAKKLKERSQRQFFESRYSKGWRK